MCAIIGFDSPTLTEQEIRPYFDRTISRGPDMSRMEKAGRGMLGFHRLAIMGLHEEGMQPFHLGGDMAVCNGELYGFRPLKKELEAKGYTFASESDCELILPLYRESGVRVLSLGSLTKICMALALTLKAKHSVSAIRMLNTRFFIVIPP